MNVTAGEQCDDGNNLDGDGCSPTCETEVGGEIPTVSEWGLVVMTSLILAAGALALRRHPVSPAR